MTEEQQKERERLRDEFAMAALSSSIDEMNRAYPSNKAMGMSVNDSIKATAILAYRYADAMLDARERK